MAVIPALGSHFTVGKKTPPEWLNQIGTREEIHSTIMCKPFSRLLLWVATKQADLLCLCAIRAKEQWHLSCTQSRLSECLLQHRSQAAAAGRSGLCPIPRTGTSA